MAVETALPAELISGTPEQKANAEIARNKIEEVRLKWDEQSQKRRAANPLTPEQKRFATTVLLTNSRGTVMHDAMGDYLIKNLNVCKINGALHIYDNGIYRQGEEALHGAMIQIVQDIPDAKRREVYRYLKANPATPVREISPPQLIPFKSKVYDFDSGKFLDYSPEHVFLNRFPYDYVPDAPEQKIVTDFTYQITGGDAGMIQLLYEAVGNCFYFRNIFRGAVMLYGRSGHNGKSTLLNMIRQLLGGVNISALSLHDLNERFRLVGLYGKAANIGDDISSRYLPETENFKKAVTGESVTVEHKGQDAFSFTPFAKMFFAMNQLPPVSDRSKAFFSRILLIPLNQDFSKAPDVRLKDRVWTQAEMEWLTVLAMRGLYSLRFQGGFTKPKAVVELTSQYERDSNPLAEFIEDTGTLEGRPVSEAYAGYQAWCGQAGHKNTFTRAKFTQEIGELTGLKSKPMRHANYPGKTPRCFVGVVSDCDAL